MEHGRDDSCQVKAKVYIVLPFFRQQGVWGSGLWLHTFLTPALDGGESSASHSGRCTSVKRPGAAV